MAVIASAAEPFPFSPFTTAAYVCGALCCLASVVAALRMFFEVQKRLPADERISFWRWYWMPGPRRWLKTEYRRLCPDGGLERQVMVSQLLAVFFFLVFAHSVGFFSWLWRLLGK
jgi:hypothetical protein